MRNKLCRHPELEKLRGKRDFCSRLEIIIRQVILEKSGCTEQNWESWGQRWGQAGSRVWEQTRWHEQLWVSKKTNETAFRDPGQAERCKGIRSSDFSLQASYLETSEEWSFSQKTCTDSLEWVDEKKEEWMLPRARPGSPGTGTCSEKPTPRLNFWQPVTLKPVPECSEQQMEQGGVWKSLQSRCKDLSILP